MVNACKGFRERCRAVGLVQAGRVKTRCRLVAVMSLPVLTELLPWATRATRARRFAGMHHCGRAIVQTLMRPFGVVEREHSG